jgi:thioredoxin-like negative regulator of GroEL
MRNFRILALAMIAQFAVLNPANAAEVRDFDRAAFNAAQASGRPILVDVKAWWCPVCASQSSTIKKAITAAEYAKLIVFNVNFDKQKDVWKSFSVSKQGTLIGYHGTRQTGRLDFATDKIQINALLAKTLR